MADVLTIYNGAIALGTVFLGSGGLLGYKRWQNRQRFIKKNNLKAHCEKEHEPIMAAINSLKVKTEEQHKETRGYLVNICNEMGIQATRENPVIK
jgi:hypothetical protein